MHVLLDVDPEDGDIGEAWVLDGGGDDFGLLGVRGVAEDVELALVRAFDGGHDYTSSFLTL